MQYEWPVPSEEQDQSPYVDGLVDEAAEQTVRGQAPGHFSSGRLPEEFLQILRRAELYDVSVMRGVDVAKERGTKSPLQRAEELCAELYGAKLCKFVTTGATQAAKAAALALFETVGRKGRFAVQASVHISVIDALAGVGARVVMVPTRMNSLGVATVLDPNELERVLEQHPDIGGVIVSTPSYEGAVAEIQRLVDIAHAHDAAVMFDSSWGTELGLSPDLPVSAVQAGADVVVGSPHKSMWALGQSAWVHLPHGSRITELTFGAEVRKQQSTSKSSLFVAGLDSGRRYAALNASELIARSIATVKEEEDRLGGLKLGHLVVPWDGVDHIPYREVFDVRETGYTGYELGALLLQRHVQVAQANIGFICCGFGVGADSQIRATFSALVDVVRGLKPRPRLEEIPLPPLRLREIDFGVVPGSEVELVPFGDAIGRLAKYPMGGYPPGFCVVLPGGRIEEADIAYLDAISDRGARLFGHPDEVPPGHVAVIRE